MVEVNNLTTVSVKKDFLKKIAIRVLKEEKKKRAGLSIVLVGPSRMKKLNKKYLKKNSVTDVLAFGQSKEFPIIPADELSLGEIVICPSEIKKNVKFYSSSFKKELARVLIHGILHLLGYNHEVSKAKEKVMEEKQKYYFSKFFK